MPKGGAATVQSPAQVNMDEDELRRCRLQSASMPRLRTNSMPTTSAGADFWKNWARRAGNSIEAAAATGTCFDAREKVCAPLVRSRPTGKSDYLSRLDEEKVLFEASPPSSSPSSQHATLPVKESAASWPASWPDSPQDKQRESSRMSTASTSAGSSSSSTSRQSCQSRSSWASMQSQESRAEKALLKSLPLPLNIRSWDWPLSRDEKKALVLMFDRQELVVERDALTDEVTKLRDVC